MKIRKKVLIIVLTTMIVIIGTSLSVLVAAKGYQMHLSEQKCKYRHSKYKVPVEAIKTSKGKCTVELLIK